jgi:hypothetical protein
LTIAHPNGKRFRTSTNKIKFSSPHKLKKAHKIFGTSEERLPKKLLKEKNKDKELD